jgi:ubiquinone/menaquinone biosynthesis C-methylase UbiE
MDTDAALSNKRVYEAVDVVEYYSSLAKLFKPERTILNMVEKKLKDMKMLDIGVGGGRTALYFKDLVNEYVGIDYSAAMIKECERKFSNSGGNVFFKTSDVRDLRDFKNNYFDFILCSCNGIDYITHEDRLRALKEIKRVGRPDGLFCFSTHNLDYMLSWLNGKFEITSFGVLVKTIRFAPVFLVLRFKNRDLMKKCEGSGYAIIADEALGFRLRTYHVRTRDQINQLEEMGFKNIRIFSTHDGREIENYSQSDAIANRWLYYLCNF